jgi:hypothetical protein
VDAPPVPKGAASNSQRSDAGTLEQKSEAGQRANQKPSKESENGSDKTAGRQAPLGRRDSGLDDDAQAPGTPPRTGDAGGASDGVVLGEQCDRYVVSSEWRTQWTIDPVTGDSREPSARVSATFQKQIPEFTVDRSGVLYAFDANAGDQILHVLARDSDEVSEQMVAFESMPLHGKFAYRNLSDLLVAPDGTKFFLAVATASAGVIGQLSGTGSFSVYAAQTEEVLDQDFARQSWKLALLARDSRGALYSTEANRIVRLRGGATVDVVAGAEQAGTDDGAGGADGPARFDRPRSLAIGPDDEILVATRQAVRRVDQTGFVQTVAREAVASFIAAHGLIDSLAVDESGDVYITSSFAIAKISRDGTAVTHIAGTSPYGTVDGIGCAAQFQNPHLVGAVGGRVYVHDHGDHRVRVISER